MMQQEFEERTGMKVTVEEYAKIEKLYMAAGNIDKDTFCKEYKKVASSKLVGELQISLRIAEGKVTSARMQLEAAEKRESELGTFLMEQAQILGSSELRQKAIDLLGAKEYMLRKLKSGTPLWDDDREILIETLNNIEY